MKATTCGSPRRAVSCELAVGRAGAGRNLLAAADDDIGRGHVEVGVVE